MAIFIDGINEFFFHKGEPRYTYEVEQLIDPRTTDYQTLKQLIKKFHYFAFSDN